MISSNPLLAHDTVASASLVTAGFSPDMKDEFCQSIAEDFRVYQVINFENENPPSDLGADAKHYSIQWRIPRAPGIPSEKRLIL